MSEPFLGEIDIFAFGYAPKGWVQCNGQTLPINQNQALFSLLGTTYGGNGTTTFMLPNLQGRVAMGQGNGQGLTPRVIGGIGGEETHTLTVNETPVHTHTLNAVARGDTTKNVDTPGPTVALATTTGKKGNTGIPVNIYVADSNPNQPMAPGAIGSSGGQPHSNLMPFATMNFCIAITGIYPSRN